MSDAEFEKAMYGAAVEHAKRTGDWASLEQYFQRSDLDLMAACIKSRGMNAHPAQMLALRLELMRAGRYGAFVAAHRS